MDWQIEQENLFADWRSPGLGKILASVRAEKRAIFVANGVFDILHRGHLEVFAYAKHGHFRGMRYSGQPFVLAAINSDASVRAIKGPTRPYIDECTRLRVVAALRDVDAAVLFHEETPEAMLRYLQPDAVVKGGDVRGIANASYPGGPMVLYSPHFLGPHTGELARSIHAAVCREV